MKNREVTQHKMKQNKSDNSRKVVYEKKGKSNIVPLS